MLIIKYSSSILNKNLLRKVKRLMKIYGSTIHKNTSTYIKLSILLFVKLSLAEQQTIRLIHFENTSHKLNSFIFYHNSIVHAYVSIYIHIINVCKFHRI